MAEGRFQILRIDRKIPIPVWIAVGAIGISTTLLSEAMLINSVASYQRPLVQYAKDHRDIDEAQLKVLPPVPAPSEWAYWEGTFGNRSLIVGLVLASMAAMVRLAKVRLRWLGLRSLGALLVAFFSGVTLVNVVPAHELEYFSYVNSGLCVEGCFYIPQPIGGSFGTVAIAVIVSVLVCVVLGVVAIARSLPRIRRKTAHGS
jgi:hypothetical protein